MVSEKLIICSLALEQVLVSASGLYPDDGRTLPANVSQGVILIPSSSQVLRNSIETAGDPGKIQRSYSIVGDEFGVPLNPMPRALNLTSTGYNCSTAQLIGGKVARCLLIICLCSAILMKKTTRSDNAIVQLKIIVCSSCPPKHFIVY